MTEQELRETIRQYSQIDGVREVREYIRLMIDKWTDTALSDPSVYPEYRGRVLGLKQILKDTQP